MLVPTRIPTGGASIAASLSNVGFVDLAVGTPGGASDMLAEQAAPVKSREEELLATEAEPVERNLLRQWFE